MVRIILKEQEGFEGMLRPCFETTFQYKEINSFPELKGAFECLVVLQYT